MNPTDLAEIDERDRRDAHNAFVEARREIDDFLFIVGTEQGRRFLWGQLAYAGVFRSSFTGDSGTYFNEGRRDTGLRTLAMFNSHAPEAYLLMTQENAN